LSQTTSPRALWLLGGAAGVLLVLLLALLFARPALERLQAPKRPAGLSGRLLLPTDEGLVVYDLAAEVESLIVPTAPGQIVSAADWSPDGSQVAYSLFHRRPGDPASSVEIFTAGADGSDARLLAERDSPGAVLDTPYWAPDGRQVYFAYIGQSGGRFVQRVERVEVASRAREVVEQDGYAPTVSPDGRDLLYLRDESAGTGLWVRPIAGGTPRAVLAPGSYPPLAVPRYSPDGQQIAAAIVNLTSARGQNGPLDWLSPPIAYAHGQPWDIWTFDSTGESATRLTFVSADDPSPAWSPDGRYIAFWSGSGLFVVPSAGGETTKLSPKFGYGAIDWVS
jgi:TolB protein